MDREKYERNVYHAQLEYSKYFVENVSRQKLDYEKESLFLIFI